MPARMRSISRSTTTAYKPSLPPKCSYTTGLVTPARAASSSIEVASKPRSANSLRPMSSSWVRRSCPVMRMRGWVWPGAATGLALTSASRRAATCYPLFGRPAHVVGPAGLLEPPDEARAGVDLPAQHPVPGGGRVGVMQVVPGLTHRRDGEPPHIDGLIAGAERAVAEGVADRVDRPGDVVQQGNPHEAGPEERGQRALP